MKFTRVFEAGIAAALLLLILFLFVVEVNAENDKTIYVGTKTRDPYVDLLDEVLSDYSIHRQDHPATQAFLEQGSGLITIDVIAKSVMNSNPNFYWYPQSKATVVFAVDPLQVKKPVKGWRDLLVSNDVISMSDQFIEAGSVITSMAYGLNPKEPVTKDAVAHLRWRYDKKKLVFNNMEMPILLLYDYQAAELIRSGHRREIIIPEEGTYTFERGILSKEILSFPSDLNERMIRHGVRTLEEDDNPEYYPPKQEYLKAVQPQDVDQIMEELIRTREYLNRYIYGTHLFSAANAQENTLSALIAIILFVFWTVSCRMRSMQKNVSYALFTIGICMVMWMGVRFVKWQFSTDSLTNRYLWYSYYIFMLSMANAFLWMAISISNPEKEVVMPLWLKILVVFEVLLLMMIFTNDIHQMVFVFDGPIDLWNKNYTYGKGYYLVYLSFLMPLMVGIFVLCVQIWRSPKRIRIIMPVTLIFLLILYSAMYISRVPVIFKSDVTLMTCLFTLSFGESAMRTGLIPLNTKYVDLFDNSSLNMRIVSANGDASYSSRYAEKIPETLMKEIHSIQGPFIYRLNPEKLLHADRIKGGIVIWQEDIGEMVELQNQIKQSVDRLKRTNEMLEKHSALQAEHEAVKAKAILHQELNIEVGDKLRKLDLLVKEMKNLSQEGKSEEYEHILAQINLTAVYIKRRCNLLFYVEQAYMSADAIVTYISEILEFAEQTGIESAPVLSLKNEIETPIGIFLYDFCFSVLEFLFQGRVQEMVLHLYSEEKIYLRFIAETDFSLYEIPEKLKLQLSQYNAKVHCKCLGDAQSIQLEIPIL